MPEYAGPLESLVLSRTLWLVLAWPLAGLLWQAFVARHRIARAGRSAAPRVRVSARNAAIATLSLTTASVLAHLLVLARLPRGQRVLFEHLARGPRFGLLAANFDVTLDAPSAATASLACVVALGAAIFLATRGPEDAGWRTWAWIHLALWSALLAFLGDGLVLVAMGWALSAAASAWLAGWGDAHVGAIVATRGAFAVAALLLGGALLFWGLGGGWQDEDFSPDPQPRFVAARVGPWRADERASSSPDAGGGWLTMTSAPGARLFVDEARAASMRAPFVRVPVQGGTHSFRIHPGGAADDVAIGRVTFAGDEEIAIVQLGPTLSLRGIADQLALRDREGRPVVATALESHAGPAGFAVVPTVLVAWLLAAAALSAQPLAASAPRALMALAYGATNGLLGPYLLARAAFLFPLAPHASAVVAGVGGAILLGAVWRALGYEDMRRWLAFSAGAPPALACVALGTGGVASAIEAMILTGLAAAVLHFWVAGRAGTVTRSVPWRDTLGDALLVDVPTRLGELLVSMERWVVQAVAGAVATLTAAGAWAVAHADEHVVASPADAVAARLERAARRVEPWVGVPLGGIAWALLALVLFALILHGLWPGG
jgi:NADH:ubiquinone oxidoreductase subunit 5 (subunit L)/multisubunit Na+/H+ antiporter MnhA subunit